MPKQLTEMGVKRAKPGKKPRFLYDAAATGLCLKVLPSGKKVWFMQSIFPGYKTQSKRSLGHYPALGLREARAKADEWHAFIRNGIDPSEVEAERQRKVEKDRREAEERRRAEALKDANTFGAFVEDLYIAKATNRRSKTDAREIRRNLIAEWHKRPIHMITARDVRKLIEKLATRAPWEARNVWSHAVQIFKVAVHEELIDVSPCASLDKRLLFKNVSLRPRTRVLNDEELAALWRATESLGYPYGPLYRLLMLTGVRISEVSGARWGEFNLPKRLWTIPPERFKSGQVHLVPLSGEAMKVIEAQPRWNASCCIFSTTIGGKPVNGFSVAKTRLDALMAKELGAETELWVNHDIRRTFRTRLSELRIPEHVAELCIGHARTGIKGVYDRHNFIDERREAFDAWAGKLRSIVDPDDPPKNVVELNLRAS